MRSKKSCLILLLLFGALVSALFLSSCTKTDSAVTIFNDFKGKWQKGNYKAMYGMLSKKAKSSISEKDFVDRYTNIYKGIEEKNLAVKIKNEKSIKEGSDTTKIPYTLNMDTIAGKVKISNFEASLVKEDVDGKKQWKIDWAHNMIFPNLTKDDKVRVNVNAAKRGELYDRNGKGLAVNGTIISLGIHPVKFNINKDANTSALAKVLDIDASIIESKLKANTNPDQFVPVVKMSPDDKDRLNAALKIDGVISYNNTGRIYNGGEAFGSLIGYIGPITAEELKKAEGQGYTSGSFIGKAGLEQVYEKRLKGQSGAEIYISKQKDGKEVKKISIVKSEAKDGETIKLSIDADLQSKIYAEMNKDAGASTAVNPKTGQVLAMVSSPSYDSNIKVTYTTNSQAAAWKQSAKDPFQNRFKQVYSPGSVFKLVTAATGLSTGKIKTTDTLNVQGLNWQPDKSWGSYMITRVKDPGKAVNLEDALVYSDNIYFAKAALAIGKSDFVKGCAGFGIGEALPFDYPIAKSQVTNGGDIKNDVALADSGYGQGQILVSPINIALMYSSLVNDGNIMTPSLELSSESTPKVWKEKAISADNIKILTDDLTAVIENTDGTGHAAKIDGIPLLGKTGTPELKKNNDDKNAIENGWFVCLNTKDPKLCVSMIVEDVRTRGESHYVVPKVKNIMEYYLKK